MIGTPAIRNLIREGKIVELKGCADADDGGGVFGNHGRHTAAVAVVQLSGGWQQGRRRRRCRYCKNLNDAYCVFDVGHC